MQEITVKELKERLDSGEDVQLIDVREPNEFEFARIEGAKLIPLREIISRMGEIDEAKETIVQCHVGGRSARAIMALQQAGFSGVLKNLRGGISAWSNEIDPNVPRY